ncbi:hypothetical protein P7K49_018951 [Saguinus oedipus]|uniref:Uncharacterized protein n=1 Tax=Saguinus oedipus TaxID=9490 RepID=A0ABQ9UW49_SAGOE|nr:hypothetical protein P7K49_018951 [Saguinus oedipus]
MYATSIITSCSLTSSSLSSASPVATSSSYDQSSVHNRIPYQSPVSPSESAPGTIMNGHSGGQSQQTLDTASSIPAPKTAGPPSAPRSGSSLPSTTTCTALPPSTSQHTGNLTGSSLSQLSSSLSSHQSSLSSAHTALSSSMSHTHASVENTPSLQSSATFSMAATSTSSSASSGASLSSSMHSANSLCLGGTPECIQQQHQGRAFGDLRQSTPKLSPTGASPAAQPVPCDVTKFGHGDSASPAPPTTPAQPQQSQLQTHYTAQQPFLNPALPPGYSYTGLPYYTGMPSAFQYGPTMFSLIASDIHVDNVAYFPTLEATLISYPTSSIVYLSLGKEG